MEDALRRLEKLDKEVQLLKHTAALLSWDQETYMPEAALEERAEQSALIEAIIHERMVSAEVGELLAAVGDITGAEERQGAFVREMKRQFDRLSRIPTDLVRRLARQASLAQSRWLEAKRRSDFTIFAPNLERLVDLTLEKAGLLGGDCYDALLDEFEPWMKSSAVDALFSGLRDKLKDVLDRIAGSPNPVDDRVLHRSYGVAKQKEFVVGVLRRMGFDDSSSRLDVSAHPFTTALGSRDVRLTNRYQEQFLNSGIFGAIHEGGHGLYELGFDASLYGGILADGTSMGIHESQSRLWENMIGRSAAFWRFFFPRLRRLFPEAVDGADERSLYLAVNRVAPSHIRVEADEVTYNLHIILRFNLERMLLSGRLDVGDLPDAWREQSRQLLGIVPERDDEGVLQDIHWSMGMFGYFPTYCLGNMYAAQFFEAMQADMPDLLRDIEVGELAGILEWLREKIHRHGRIYPAHELCSRVTGKELSSEPFVTYLNAKYGEIYGF